MSPSDPPATPAPSLDRLLAEIHLRVRQGQFAEAQERLTRAKQMAPEHPAVLEMEGDLAFAQRKYRQAEQLYQRALLADPTNDKAEEKYATALVKAREPEILAHVGPDTGESIWAMRIPRPPWASALLSILFPGLGQMYNGELLKGGIVAVVALALLRTIVVYFQHAQPGTSRTSVLGGSHAIVPVLLLAASLYSIVDAILIARSTQEDASPSLPTAPARKRLPPLP